MARNWAICIGVNQYDFLQPLNYAQRDAQLMQEFLCNEAAFDRVLLFQDSSPDKLLRSTRTNLLRSIRQLVEDAKMGAGDNFWFFFSGHGMRHEGRDYLMPLDGDQGDIENTAISISFVTDRLRCCGADNVVLILDACRNTGSGSKGGEGIGQQTAEVAKQTGVITIFSCSPNEYSYEIEALQQGVFTCALLEGLGLQGQCATVEKLNYYLTRRVPELNRQYKKGQQTPFTIAEPVTKSHLILLPRYATQVEINIVKIDAYQAQEDGNLELAEQLWIRVNAAALGKDLDAIRALQKIALLKTQLVSAVKVDYSKLQKLLSDGKWKEADGQTVEMMLKVAGREKEGWLKKEDIETFPCEDLRTIDKLWVKYSNERFGFSIQTRIWRSFGGQPGCYDYEPFKKFGDRVGWYKKEKDDWKFYADLTFSLNAPQGHLPSIGRGLHIGEPVGLLSIPLFSRIQLCKI